MGHHQLTGEYPQVSVMITMASARFLQLCSRRSPRRSTASSRRACLLIWKVRWVDEFSRQLVSRTSRSSLRRSTWPSNGLPTAAVPPCAILCPLPPGPKPCSTTNGHCEFEARRFRGGRARSAWSGSSSASSRRCPTHARLHITCTCVHTHLHTPAWHTQTRVVCAIFAGCTLYVGCVRYVCMCVVVVC